MKGELNGFRRFLAILMCITMILGQVPATAESVPATPTDLEETSSAGSGTDAGPYEQKLTAGGTEITLTADSSAAVNGELSVSCASEDELIQAAEALLNPADDESLTVRHAIYRFSGAELSAGVQVRMKKLGLKELRETYPDGEISVSVVQYIPAGEKLSEKGKLISSSCDEDQDKLEFSIRECGLYDVVTVIRNPETSEPTEEPEPGETNEPAVPTEPGGNPDPDNPAEPIEASDSAGTQAKEWPAFEQSRTVGGVLIRVQAEKGVFPPDAQLSVTQVPVTRREQADAAVDEVRDGEQCVAVSYTFDIRILDADGNEIQPADGQKVSVLFSMAEVADENLETQVYHITEEAQTGEMTAEKLDVSVEDGDTAVVETDGFSLYTVEFTYQELEYSLPGGDTVPLSDILAELGLNGDVTDAETSDSGLFSVSDETGEWIVASHRAFDTDEWLRVTINGITYRITVTDDNVTGLDGAGTEEDPYRIGSETEWNRFCTNLRTGIAADRHYMLTADITVSTPAAEPNHPFSGVFDGDGHTLTANVTLYVQYGGPFRAISGAVIRNLTIGGTTNTTQKFFGGVAGKADGNNTIQNVTVTTNLKSNLRSDNSSGGFIGMISSGTTIFSNCAFVGQLNFAGYSIGGYVGWVESNNDGTAIFHDCLFDNQNGSNGGAEACTFARARNQASLKFNRAYYRTPLLNPQGTPVYFRDDVPATGLYSVILTRNGNQYYAPCTVSGPEKTYAYPGDKDTVMDDVTVLNAEGTLLERGTHYAITFSKNSISNIGAYELTVTGGTDSKGSVTRPFSVTGEIRYAEADNTTEHTLAQDAYTVLDESDTVLTGGWYYVNRNLTIGTRLTVSGSVNLILGSGYTLSIPKGIGVPEGSSLTIWQQKTDTAGGAGKLTINNVDDNCAGIGATGIEGVCGFITINGGILNVTGGSYYGAGIGQSCRGTGGSIAIHGGQVTAQGGFECAAIGGAYQSAGCDITITGGRITATGRYGGAGIGGGKLSDGGTIRISGGEITANVTGGGSIGIGHGTPPAAGGLQAEIILSYPSVSNGMSVDSTGYGGKVRILNPFWNEESAVAFLPTESADKSAMAGKALTPFDGKIDSWNKLRAVINGAGEGDVITLTESLTAGSSDPVILIPEGKNITIDLNGFTLDRGLASSASREDGGVIQVSSGASLTIADSAGTGMITGGNSSGDGGGILNTGTLTMTGGTITGNTAASGGGIKNDGTLNMSGSPKVTGNTQTNGSANNVRIDSEASAIHVTAPGLDSGAQIGISASAISLSYESDHLALRFSTRITTTLPDDHSWERFTSDDPANGLTGVSPENAAILGIPVTVRFQAFCGSGSMDPDLYPDDMIQVPYGSVYVLPESGFTGDKGDFIAWRINQENTLRQPGDTITITDTSFTVLTALYPVTYLNGDGSTGYSDEYRIISSNTNPSEWSGYYVVMDDVTISDVRYAISEDETAYLILCNGTTLTLPRGIQVKTGSTLNIHAQSTDKDTMGKLVINNVMSGNAGIGGGSTENPGMIRIAGGDITVRGGENAAGIGGGNGKAGSRIDIEGGFINTQGGGNGAGIGGGYVGAGGIINIKAGTVIAWGGQTGKGAGIGGGAMGDGGTISISGGYIEANGGGAGGAGIGSGCFTSTKKGNGGTITISNGEVHATCGSNSAGIGGGDYSSGGTIRIEGGQVYAKGHTGNGAASIGPGHGSTEADITLTWTRDTKGTIRIEASRYIGTVRLGESFYHEGNPPKAFYKKADGSFDPTRLNDTVLQAWDGVIDTWAMIQLAINEAPVPDDANPEPTEITLQGTEETIRAISGVNTTLTIPSNQKIIINLNGHSLNASDINNRVFTVSGELTITGDGTITGGYSVYGGGIYVSDTGRLIIHGGNIQNNIAMRQGGGIYLASRASMEMDGGSVQSNTSQSDGGGIYIASSAKAVISDGSISNNSSMTEGGGFAIEGSLAISGGTITGNSCNGRGGAIFGVPNNYGTLSLYGNPVIAGNTGGNGNNIYLPWNFNRIRIDGKLLKTASIGIKTDYEPSYGKYVVFTSNSLVNRDEIIRFFPDDTEKYAVATDPQGRGVWGLKITVSFSGGIGSGNMASIDTVSGVTFTFPECTFTPPEDLSFAGWKIEGESDLHIPGDSIVLKDSVQLTAVYGMPYEDEKEKPHSAVDYQVVAASDTLWKDGWYVIYDDVTVPGRIQTEGAVFLIVRDGATLEAMEGIGVNAGSSLTIYGQHEQSGRIEALVSRSSSSHASIGADYEYAPGTVTINGGIIHAENERASAAIGNSNKNGGVIIINRGDVTATGGEHSAGIGGCYGGDGCTITINGGTVNATGRDGGAGIGGGVYGGSGTIIINGGTVNATGDDGGAGIGGGRTNSTNGTITINGGIVNATGRNYGSGIGGGAGVSFGTGAGIGGDIIIRGGQVIAVSNGYSIGRGFNSSLSTYTRITMGWTEESRKEMFVYAPDGYTNAVFLESAFESADDPTRVYFPGQFGYDTVSLPNETKLVPSRAIYNWATLQAGVEYAEDGEELIVYADCTANADQTAIMIAADKNVSIDLNGFSINRNLSGERADGSVFINQGTATIINSHSGRTSRITGGNTTGDGGGILNTGTLTIRGVNVASNHAGGNGGGISNTGTLTVEDSDIMNNTAGSGGGGIHNNDGTVTVEDSIIRGNEAGSGENGLGGGIYSSNGNVNISDTDIDTNNSDKNGGGVYGSNAAITISGGTIASNTAANFGGGIYANAGTVTLTDHVVSANKAKDGAGIYALKGASIVMQESSSVLNNKATMNDGTGGIWLEAKSKLKLSGTPIVLRNTNGSGATKNVLVPGRTDMDDMWIVLDGPLEPDACVGITLAKNPQKGNIIEFTTPLTQPSDKKRFRSDDPTYIVDAKPNGGAVLGYPVLVQYRIGRFVGSREDEFAALGNDFILPDISELNGPCGIVFKGWKINGGEGYTAYGSMLHIQNDAPIVLTAVFEVPYIDQYGAPQSADCVLPVEGEDSLQMSAGWYALIGPQQFSERSAVSGDVKIIVCNGANIWTPGITVLSGNSLTIYGQEGQTGKLYSETHFYDEGAGIGGVARDTSGKITINSGWVRASGGINAAGIGGGTSGRSTEIQINNGTVSAIGGDEGAGIGGGVNAPGGTITITGGMVTAYGDGGGAGIGGGNGGYGGSITITGGSVTANGGQAMNQYYYAGAGIGGGGGESGGSITIRGGTITAHGDSRNGNASAGIGNGGGSYDNPGAHIVLGWTDATKERISISCDMYRGEVLFEKPFRDSRNEAIIFLPGILSDTGITPDDRTIIACDEIKIYTWKQLQAAINAIPQKTETRLVLEADIWAEADDTRIIVPEYKRIILDLNGHSMDRRSNGLTLDGNVITVESRAALSIEDSKGTGVITGGRKNGRGGAIYCSGELNLRGGTILNNQASEDGGAISMQGPAGQFRMSGGAITGNRSGTSGGAIRIYSGATVVIAGGLINDNTAGGFHGGAIYNSGELTISGGQITGNRTAQQGGAILQYDSSSSMLNIEGSPFIANNIAASGNNIYLRPNTVIHVSGKLDKDTVINVHPETGTRPLVITSGLPGKGSASNFQSDVATDIVTLNENGEAQLGPGTQVRFQPGEGTGSMADDITAKGSQYRLPESRFTEPAGSSFIGWTVVEDGGEPTGPFNAGKVIDIGADAELVILTAQYGRADYDVWINGIRINDSNKNDVLGDGSGSVRFDPETETLTMNSAVIETGANPPDAAIRAEVSLTILGSGRISGFTTGIQGTADLIISAGITIEEADTGVQADGDVSISGGMMIDAAGTGITAGGSVTVSDSLSIITGENGIYADGDVTIDHGTVIITPPDGTAYFDEYGIQTSAGFTVRDSYVEITGGMYGVDTADDITIDNSTFKATTYLSPVYGMSSIYIDGADSWVETRITNPNPRFIVALECDMDGELVLGDSLGIVRPAGGRFEYGQLLKADGGDSTECQISRYVPLEDIALDPIPTLHVGDVLKIEPTYTPADTSSKQVTWKSSNTNVATIDEDGTIHAIKKGTTTITVTAEGGYLTASRDVTIEAAAARFNITIASDEIEHGTITYGAPDAIEGEEIHLTITPDPGYGLTRLWWVSESGDTDDVQNGFAMPKKHITLYATFALKTYRIHFDANRGTGVMADMEDITCGTPRTLAANTFTRPGHSFLKWNTAADGSGTDYADGASVDITDYENGATVTLYAQWDAQEFHVSTGIITGDGTLIINKETAYCDDTIVVIPQAETGNTIQTVTYTPDGGETTAIEPMFGMYSFLMPDADVRVDAEFRANQYRVRFDANAEGVTGEMADQAFTYNGALTPLLPNAYTREGYTFAGWNTEAHPTEANPGTAYGDQVNVRNLSALDGDTVTLHAQWNINSYTITFDTAGGSTVDPVTQEYGSTVASPERPTRAGYEFAGWNPEIPKTMPAEDTVITAVWRAKQHTITFDTDGGSAVTPITLGYEEPIIRPDDPTKTGYTFNRWKQTDPETTEDLDIPERMPDYSLTYLAVWDINQYTITFLTNAGETTAFHTIRQNYNTAIMTADIPTPEKEGYDFAGWDYPIPATMPAQDVTITALWTKGAPYYRISFTDGEQEYHSIMLHAGETIPVPQDPARTGYTFSGWEPAVPETMPAENVTVEAVWTPVRYTITFDSDGGSNVDPMQVDYGTEVTAPADPTREGYTFRGWTPALPVTMPAENLNVKAAWQKNEYTITFMDGEELLTVIRQEYDTAVTRPADPEKEGYTFSGWDREVPQAMPAENMTIHAVWTAKQFTITFDTAGGSEIPAITADYGTGVTAPADPVREGYTFAGWDVPVPETMPAHDMTITAVWAETAVSYYSLKYMVDGRTVYQTLLKANDPIPMPPETPVRTGYSFGGWEDIPEVMPASDLTIQAKDWVIRQFTITFDTAGGSAIPAVTQDYDTAVAAPEDPRKEGYTFQGWNRSIPATMPAEDLTITVVWQINAYTVHFKAEATDEDDYTTITQNYGTEIVLPADPAKEGYTFDGWDPDIPEGMTMPATDPESPPVYVAKWKINQSTITFITDEDDTVPPYHTITADYGTEVTAPAEDPTKTGYTFAGWEPAVPATMPAEDLTIRAKWTTVPYTITFMTDAETEYLRITQAYGTPVTAPANPEKEGYVFSRWNAQIPETMPARNLTITAVWNPEMYTVTWMDGETVLAERELAFGSSIPAQNNPTKEGYTFAGWDYPVPAKMPAHNLVFHANWEESGKTYYTLNFYRGALDVYYTLRLQAGEAITPEMLPPNPEKEGNRFIGWQDLPETMPAESTLTYAEWEPIPYTILFMDGDTLISEHEQYYNTAIPESAVPADPEKAGYDFTGWNPALPETMPAEDLILQAVWQALPFTLTFDTDGGNPINPITQDCGTEITKPADPVKTGSEFLRWKQTDPATTTDLAGIPDTMPPEDTTVTALWNDLTFTIQFNTDGGTQIAPITGKYGIPVTRPDDPEKAGYTFGGWDKPVPATMPAGSMTISAVWRINPYTITFDSDGGTSVDPITQDYGTAVTAPANPTREGYTFQKWNPAVPETMPAENLTVQAVWQANTYTIRFIADDTEGAEPFHTITGAYGTDVSAPDGRPAREGYTFAGWDHPVPATMPAGDMTIRAVWTENVAGFSTMTFMNLGETWYLLMLAEGEPVTKPADPDREGYVFRGWRQTIPATTTDLAEIPETMPADDRTYEAQWTEDTFTITFDSNGGSEVSAITAAFGAGISAPVPVRNGYTFVQWEPEVPAAMPAKNMTVKAVWKANPYTLTFDPNGGTAINPITQDYGTPVTKPEDPEKTGSTFRGWRQTDPATTTDLTEVPETMPATDMTLQAQWNINQYTITFDTDGGSPVSPITQDYGTAVTQPADPTLEGKTFAGWNPGIPATMPAKDMTVQAIWIDGELTCCITFMNGDEVYYRILMPAGTQIMDSDKPVNPEKSGYTFSGWTPAIPETMPSGGMTIYADWTPESHIITFDTAGGTPIDAIQQEYDTTVTKPDNPIKTGYTFAGWNPEIPDRMPAEDMTILAKWTANTYHVAFDPNAPAAEITGTMENQPLTYDGEETALAANQYVRERFTFAGWNTQAEPTEEEPGTAYSDREPVKNLTAEADGVFTLYAQWTPVPVTGISVTPKAARIGVGGELLLLTAAIEPENACNQNVTWTSEDETIATVDDYGIVTAVSGGETVIRATTEEGGFTDTAVVKVMQRVDYVSADGTPQDAQVCEFLTEDMRVLDDPEGSWYAVSGSVEIPSRVTVTGNIHLILCDDAELRIPDGITVEEGASLTIWGQDAGTGKLTITDARDGFAGIGGTDGRRGGRITIHGGTVDVAGGYSAAAIGGGGNAGGGPITIDGGHVTARNGGIGAGRDAGNAGEDTAITLNGTIGRMSVHADSYNGTVTRETNFKSTDPYEIFLLDDEPQPTNEELAGRTLRPCGSETVTVSFNKGSESASGSMKSLRVEKDELYTLPVCGFTAPDGLTFAGWKTTGTTGLINPGEEIEIAADTEFTASWGYAVDIGATPHGTVTARPIAAMEDSTVTLTIQPDEGYSLKEGSLAVNQGSTSVETTDIVPAEGETPLLTSTFIMPGGDVEVTAEFQPNTYAVRYEANASAEEISGSMADQPFTYDEPQRLNPNDYARADYTFGGWNTEATPTDLAPGTPIRDGARVQNLTSVDGGIVQLFAQWIRNVYTISISSGKGKVVSSTDTAVSGTPVTLTVTPNRGYHPDILILTPEGGEGQMFTLDENGQYTFEMPAANVTVIATFAANPYTVRFDPNGPDSEITGEMAAQSFLYDTAKNLAANRYERYGYTFTGWNEAADGSSVFYPDQQEVINLTDEADDEVTLYARWSRNFYNIITIQPEHGKLSAAPLTSYARNPVILLPEPDDGYMIEQVTYSPASDRSPATPSDLDEDEPEQTEILPNENGKYVLTMPDMDTAVRTVFRGIPYTVAFNAGEGTGTMEAQEFRYGEEQNLSANTFTRTGYSFVRWNTSPDGQGTPYYDKQRVKDLTMLSGDTITLYAQYEINQYTITFDSDGGTEIEPITQDYGTAVTPPADPEKTGYTFDRWKQTDPATTTDLAGIPETIPAEDVTVTALWIPNLYTIFFDTDGGSKIDPITQEYSTTITPPADPTKTGYTFSGWEPDIPETIPAEDTTVKALWTINQYTITFDSDGGTEISPITQDYGTQVAAPADPEKTGYTFDRWKQTDPATTTDLAGIPETIPAEDVTVTALWIPNLYTITFDPDGGSETQPITQEYGTKVTPPADPARTGYTFSGWEPEIPETIPAEDVTVKAQWTPNLYTITFDAEGGSETEPITQEYGTKVTPPADPTRPGYTFNGWEPEIPATVPAEDVTVKAQWTVNEYTIVLKDGDQEIARITAPYGGKIQRPDDPAKDGFTFTGWEPELPETMPVVPPEGLTFKATWAANPTPAPTTPAPTTPAPTTPAPTTPAPTTPVPTTPKPERSPVPVNRETTGEKMILTKALAAVPEAQARTDDAEEIPEGQEGKAVSPASDAIYVLEAAETPDMLIRPDEDMILNTDDLEKYQLWQNEGTGLGVTLLPNATRLYTDEGGKLQYVSEIMSGDLLRNGNVYSIEITAAMTKEAAEKAEIPIGPNGSLRFEGGTMALSPGTASELYLYEISGAWLAGKLADGTFCRLEAGDEEVRSFATRGGEMPEGIRSEGVIPAEERICRRQQIWIGTSPDTAADPDQPLIFLLLDEDTDEVTAFRTSARIEEADEAPKDVSVCLCYAEDGSCTVLFYDTPEGEESQVRILTATVTDETANPPEPIEIVLRCFDLGDGVTAYSIGGCFHTLKDGTVGVLNVYTDQYNAAFDGDTFESAYTRISGIGTGETAVTVKRGQDVWPERDALSQE